MLGAGYNGCVSLEKLRGRLLISLVFGAVVFIGLSAYADFSDVLDGLGEFKWRYLPLVLGLTSLNYVLRFFDIIPVFRVWFRQRVPPACEFTPSQLF